MTPTTKTEATQILAGKATAITRIYKDKCPYNVGDKISLTHADSRYADAQIMSIDVIPMATRMQSGIGDSLAKGEGFNGIHWWKENLKEMYGTDQYKTTWRLRLKVLDTVDKSRRFKAPPADVPKSPSPSDLL